MARSGHPLTRLSDVLGGSLPQMQAFLQECRAQHLPASQIAGLEQIIRDEGR